MIVNHSNKNKQADTYGISGLFLALTKSSVIFGKVITGCYEGGMESLMYGESSHVDNQHTCLDINNEKLCLAV